MSAAPINLRRARKARARDAARKQADANAARHGAGKAEKRIVAFEAETLQGALDGAKRDSARDDPV